MKFIITALLALNLTGFSAQNILNYAHLTEFWVEGKTDSVGNVTRQDMHRGGWIELRLDSNQNVTWYGSSDCGFGSKRSGTWILNKTEGLLIFSFTLETSYRGNHPTTPLQITETYKIEKLTPDQFILRLQGPEKVFAFLLKEDLGQE